ncbi:MAG: NADPH:quinone oxidoreductase family protein [Pseudonocardia sp.]|nr:NADPH:quinone oxidoreductase family protein [Pseudonocardia sp.]
MRCVRYGLPELLEFGRLPDPEPGPGEVLVDVHAAAVNFPDVLFVADGYQVSVPTPFTPGSEFAGVVLTAGAGADAPRPGDRVRGQVMTGAFAERIAVPADALTVAPPDADLGLAAAGGVTFATAYSALRTTAELAPGQWLAVTGAAGGVGSAAVVLGRALGARVLAVASTREKAAFCRDLGADAVLALEDHPDPPAVRERIRELCGGPDVVLDLVGGDLAEVMLRAMRRRGRFVAVGFASGAIPRIPLNLLLLKDVQVRGFEIRGFAEHEATTYARDTTELAALRDKGIGPVVSARLPLERAAEALRLVADRRATGKIVLTTAAGRAAE